VTHPVATRHPSEEGILLVGVWDGEGAVGAGLC
jgi:hypothetical protein